MTNKNETNYQVSYNQTIASQFTFKQITACLKTYLTMTLLLSTVTMIKPDLSAARLISVNESKSTARPLVTEKIDIAALTYQIAHELYSSTHQIQWQEQRPNEKPPVQEQYDLVTDEQLAQQIKYKIELYGLTTAEKISLAQALYATAAIDSLGGTYLPSRKDLDTQIITSVMSQLDIPLEAKFLNTTDSLAKAVSAARDPNGTGDFSKEGKVLEMLAKMDPKSMQEIITTNGRSLESILTSTMFKMQYDYSQANSNALDTILDAGFPRFVPLDFLNTVPLLNA
jgi:hypothetical protein